MVRRCWGTRDGGGDDEGLNFLRRSVGEGFTASRSPVWGPAHSAAAGHLVRRPGAILRLRA